MILNSVQSWIQHSSLSSSKTRRLFLWLFLCVLIINYTRDQLLEDIETRPPRQPLPPRATDREHFQENDNLLLNPDFYQGKLYWRNLGWSTSAYSRRSHSWYSSKSGERNLIIPSSTKAPGDVASVFQFVDLTERSLFYQDKLLSSSSSPDQQQKQQQQQTQIDFFLEFTVSAKIVDTNPPFNGTFRATLDAKALDGSYIYDQSLPFDVTSRDLQQRCIRVRSSKPLEYAMVFLIMQAYTGEVAVQHVSLTYSADKRSSPTSYHQMDSSTIKKNCLISDSPPYHFTNQYTVKPNGLEGTLKPQNGGKDVSVVTQLSLDRMDRLLAIGKSWKGLISAGIYIRNKAEEAKLKQIVEENALNNVYFHFVYADGGPYPVNFLRNVAMDYALTDFLILLDVDFKPSITLYDNVLKWIEKMDPATVTTTIYSIAAFEVDEGVNPVPDTTEQLLDAIDKGVVRQVHVKFAPGAHSPTDYRKWFKAKEPYPIKYTPEYEPYVLVHKSIIRFDERFKGYGWDKSSYFYELSAAGNYNWMALPFDFVLHLYHPPATWKQEQPLIYIRMWQNWYEFALEVHKRYLGTKFDYKELADRDELDLLYNNPTELFSGRPALTLVFHSLRISAVLVLVWAASSFVLFVWNNRSKRAHEL